MDLKENIFSLLGIKPDEEFKILSPFLEKDEKLYKYRLRKNMVVEYEDSFGRWNCDWTILPKLLSGEGIIKKIIAPTENEQIAINYARLLGHNWIAKDEDGTVFAFKKKPYKKDGFWSIDDCESSEIEFDISFISYEDNDPYFIGE